MGPDTSHRKRVHLQEVVLPRRLGMRTNSRQESEDSSRAGCAHCHLVGRDHRRSGACLRTEAAGPCRRSEAEGPCRSRRTGAAAPRGRHSGRDRRTGAAAHARNRRSGAAGRGRRNAEAGRGRRTAARRSSRARAGAGRGRSRRSGAAGRDRRSEAAGPDRRTAGVGPGRSRRSAEAGPCRRSEAAARGRRTGRSAAAEGPDRSRHSEAAAGRSRPAGAAPDRRTAAAAPAATAAAAAVVAPRRRAVEVEAEDVSADVVLLLLGADGLVDGVEVDEGGQRRLAVRLGQELDARHLAPPLKVAAQVLLASRVGQVAHKEVARRVVALRLARRAAAALAKVSAVAAAKVSAVAVRVAPVPPHRRPPVLRLLRRQLDAKAAPLHLKVVHPADGVRGRVGVCVLDEGKALLGGEHRDVAVLAEVIPELVLVDLVVDVADEDAPAMPILAALVHHR
eukprot:CAMPEP_0202748960 /NCGR_PEP_ID=MMETSP1388-20130828/10162_1 /ASSEMBLY_ACC=CAM_ASM_000864 /TAXON_ID=37098 /ORGANISM="Isochrysis sp, Strain CCMP1244" /LENGTH=450 /DNA_ID=CAMNT_0049416419 /DNA_START=245 /DNA_END=1596 /DNA_ORIENTATION=+